MQVCGFSLACSQSIESDPILSCTIYHVFPVVEVVMTAGELKKRLELVDENLEIVIDCGISQIGDPQYHKIFGEPKLSSGFEPANSFVIDTTIYDDRLL